VVQRRPDILVDAQGLVGAPDEAAAEEGEEEQDAVVELGAGAGHVELVEEPVEIEEGGGELVEDEGAGVEVHEWTLRAQLEGRSICYRGRGAYEAKGEHDEGADGVGEHAVPEYVDVEDGDQQVP
jgi:hypothetical protein